MQWTLIVLVAVHLLAVNLASAGPLVSAWIEWRAHRREMPAFDLAARTLAGWSMWAAVIGWGVGLALVRLMLWDASAVRATSLFFVSVEFMSVPASRWWFAAGEVLFYFVCLLSYVIVWRQLSRWRWLHILLAAAAGTNFLYHFP